MSIKDKITKGEWHVSRYNDRQYAISLTENGYEEIQISDAEDIANADCINSIPEMLDIIERLSLVEYDDGNACLLISLEAEKLIKRLNESIS